MGALLSTCLLSNLSVLLSSCRTLAIIALLASTLACSNSHTSGSAAPGAEPLLVAAASDLASMEQSLAQAFRTATGKQFEMVFAASGMLARQIEQGAPFDVYLSANEEYVKQLVERGKLDPATVSVYAIGRLGLWSKEGAINDLKQLTAGRVKHIAIANPAHAPYGMAAREALQTSGLWDQLQPRLVYGENVRQALQFAESGNADVALTAWSLVFDRGGVLVADGIHGPIRQTGGALASSKRPELAREFLSFLKGPAGREVLASHGLSIPGSGPS